MIRKYDLSEYEQVLLHLQSIGQEDTWVEWCRNNQPIKCIETAWDQYEHETDGEYKTWTGKISNMKYTLDSNGMLELDGRLDETELQEMINEASEH